MTLRFKFIPISLLTLACFCDLVAQKAVTITAADTTKESNTPPKKEAYRATNPIVCDLIHTKLEVSFDWTNSRLNGKATLTMKPHFYPTRMCYLNARGASTPSTDTALNIFSCLRFQRALPSRKN